MGEPYDFMAYQVSLVWAAACTSLTNEQATDRLNAEHPTGITSRWELATAEPNSVPCPDLSGTHRHLLFNC